MLNDRLVVLDTPGTMVGVDDGWLAAHDVAIGWLHMIWRRTSDATDDQHVRIRTSSTASTWFGRWKC